MAIFSNYLHCTYFGWFEEKSSLCCWPRTDLSVSGGGKTYCRSVWIPEAFMILERQSVNQIAEKEKMERERVEMMIMEVENERLIKLIWPWQMPFFKEKRKGCKCKKNKNDGRSQGVAMMLLTLARKAALPSMSKQFRKFAKTPLLLINAQRLKICQNVSAFETKIQWWSDFHPLCATQWQISLLYSIRRTSWCTSLYQKSEKGSTSLSTQIVALYLLNWKIKNPRHKGHQHGCLSGKKLLLFIADSSIIMWKMKSGKERRARYKSLR